MSRPPRGLTPDEVVLWAKVAATVKPLHPLVPPRKAEGDRPKAGGGAGEPVRTHPPKRPPRVPLLQPAAGPPPRLGSEAKRAPPPRPLDRHGLDASWERKLAKAAVSPDFTLDLHDHTLEAAHARLDYGLTQAIAHGARLVLLITGRPRPSDDQALRGERRGAIRAKLLDWLAAGPHGTRIVAVRQAHPRHGGAGAVYIVLKRPRA